VGGSRSDRHSRRPPRTARRHPRWQVSLGIRRRARPARGFALDRLVVSARGDRRACERRSSLAGHVAVAAAERSTHGRPLWSLRLQAARSPDALRQRRQRLRRRRRVARGAQAERIPVPAGTGSPAGRTLRTAHRGDDAAGPGSGADRAVGVHQVCRRARGWHASPPARLGHLAASPCRGKGGGSRGRVGAGIAASCHGRRDRAVVDLGAAAAPAQSLASAWTGRGLRALSRDVHRLGPGRLCVGKERQSGSGDLDGVLVGECSVGAQGRVGPVALSPSRADRLRFCASSRARYLRRPAHSRLQREARRRSACQALRTVQRVARRRPASELPRRRLPRARGARQRRLGSPLSPTLERIRSTNDGAPSRRLCGAAHGGARAVDGPERCRLLPSSTLRPGGRVVSAQHGPRHEQRSCVRQLVAEAGLPLLRRGALADHWPVRLSAARPRMVALTRPCGRRGARWLAGVALVGWLLLGIVALLWSVRRVGVE
jgi:hypothetical protein